MFIRPDALPLPVELDQLTASEIASIRLCALATEVGALDLLQIVLERTRASFEDEGRASLRGAYAYYVAQARSGQLHEQIHGTGSWRGLEHPWWQASNRAIATMAAMT